jgi:phosphoribosylanthranilate isomerase
VRAGVIFAKSPRSASVEQAKAIVEVTRKYGERSSSMNMQPEIDRLTADRLSTKLWYQRCQEYLQKTTLRRPLVVGVFQGQSVEEINDVVAKTGIDIVQLHGDESVADLERVHAPCIKVRYDVSHLVLYCGVLWCSVVWYGMVWCGMLRCTVVLCCVVWGGVMCYAILFCPILPSLILLSSSVQVLHMSPTIASENTHGIIDTLKSEIELFSGKALAILLDSRVPGTAGGGTGAVFDWSIAGKLNIPVMLAGDENVLSFLTYCITFSLSYLLSYSRILFCSSFLFFVSYDHSHMSLPF